jgi:hypothetical protein
MYGRRGLEMFAFSDVRKTSVFTTIKRDSNPLFGAMHLYQFSAACGVSECGERSPSPLPSPRREGEQCYIAG